jgi:ribosomal protein L11 methyltransferase
VRALAGDALVEVSTTEIADDWHERWRQFHRPVLIESPRQSGGARAGGARAGGARAGGARAGGAQPGDTNPPIPSLRIRPPWEAPDANPAGAVTEIVIDPGQAFGTGGHASTRLCLELLLALLAGERPVGALVDVGTGSGVLAIAAAGLGFRPVWALDNDEDSLAAARANAAVNGAQIDVRRYDLRARQLAWPPGPPQATTVVANLLRPLLLELAEAMTAPPAHLIAGGLLVGEVDEIVRAFTGDLPLRERERRQSGEWAAVWLSAAGQRAKASRQPSRPIAPDWRPSGPIVPG